MFANRYGLHLLELKNKRGPIRVESDTAWFVDGQPLVNGKESPSQQAVNTSDSLQDRLREWAKSNGIKGKLNVFPWVVLVDQHPDSSFEGGPFPYVVGGGRRCWIINGVKHLTVEVLNPRARYNSRLLLSDAVLEQLEHRLGRGFTPPGTGKLFGQLLDCQTRHGLERVRVRAQRHGGASQSALMPTNAEGQYEFAALREGVYDVIFELPSGYSDPIRLEVLLTPGFKTMLPVLVYREGMTPEERSRLSQVEHGLEEAKRQAEQATNEAMASRQEIERQSERITKLENELEAMLNLMAEVQNQPANATAGFTVEFVKTLDQIMGEREAELEEQRALVFKLEQQAARFERQAALLVAAIEERVSAIEDRVDRVERNQRELDAEQVKAEQAKAAAAAQQMRINEERWQAEQTESRQKAQRRERMTKVLTRSALIGTAGAVLSLQPLPGPDILILTPMQVALVMDVSRIYGREMTQDLVAKIIGALGAGMIGQHATVLLYKLIPGAWGLGALTVPATFLLLGWATATYFERGSMPTISEQKDALVGIKRALADSTIRDEAKQAASSIIKDLRARGFTNLTPEAIRDILERLGRDHSGLGDRFADHLGGLENGKELS